MTSKDRSKRGFSLTELLTVLAIVALLAALLLGVILGANRKAKNIKCAGNLKQLGLGLSVFVSDFHVMPSPAIRASAKVSIPNIRHPGFRPSKRTVSHPTGRRRNTSF